VEKLLVLFATFWRQNKQRKKKTLFVCLCESVTIMLAKEYNDLVDYLQSKGGPSVAYPTDDKDERANFRRKAKKFILVDGVLCHLTKVHNYDGEKTERTIRVARADELPSILEYYHSDLHKSRDSVLRRIRTEYWWSGKKRDIADWIKSCQWCQTHKPSPFEPPLRPIIEKEKNKRYVTSSSSGVVTDYNHEMANGSDRSIS
jgi:hypothetical protein